MPKVADVKTKSARKDRHEVPASGWLVDPIGEINSSIRSAKHKKVILYSVGVTLTVFLLFAASIFYMPAQAHLVVGGKTISLDIAKSTVAQQQGLSRRKSMANDRGMLFVFTQPAATCFWMKGMEFPLDIVWLNSAKQVIYVQQGVSPKSYPKQYCPSSPAKYVIELNTGQAKALDITVGKTLNI